MAEATHIDGTNKGKLMLYALSTCIWCRKTKELLKELGYAFDYLDVDLLDQKERGQIEDEIYRWNPNGGFPTLVINNRKCIAGFREEEIKNL